MFHKKVPWLGTLVNIAGMECSFRVYSLDMFEEKYTWVALASLLLPKDSFVEDCNINIQHVKEKTNTEAVITTKYVDLIKQLHVQLPRTLRQLHDGQPTLNAC